SGSIIILYLFSIISTCYYTPRLECQPCQEPKMSTMYGSSTANAYGIIETIGRINRIKLPRTNFSSNFIP
ncbi:MAG: hypothetical protein WBE68_00500, partial [Candidatus Nitrosopolaris sp.]